MSRVDGRILCGKVGGIPFVDVVRLNSTGTCPEGTKPCIKNTAVNPEYQTCYDADTVDSNLCPINDIQIVKGNNRPEFDYYSDEGRDYEMITIESENQNKDENYYVFYSRQAL